MFDLVRKDVAMRNFESVIFDNHTAEKKPRESEYEAILKDP